ncbi:MAG: M23 family metallopeptidase [Clostridia bacterium]|nr:M23 family metallopeptidase [Clostridia bacterium]
MSTLTSKKQNRVLYVTLAVLLAAAAVLSVLTFNAAKKETEALPETETKQIEPAKTGQPETKAPADPHTEKTVTEDAGLFGKKEETEAPQDAEAETDKQKTDAQPEETVSAALTLPTFLSPIENGVILRTHSVTVPVFSPTMDDYRTHTGIDIACDPASPVLAAADGRIGNFWYDPLMGYTLSVVHGGDAVTIYQGLAEELPEGIEPGVQVKAGQTIACSGNTALIECEDEEHLHFMLQIAGTDADPLEYIALPTMAAVYEG